MKKKKISHSLNSKLAKESNVVSWIEVYLHRHANASAIKEEQQIGEFFLFVGISAII